MTERRLSIVVLTFNEEENLPDCLASLRGLDADVFVVDSGSTDRTVEIARAAGAVVVSHPFVDYGAQRNWAQANAGIQTEWVFHIDADERLTPELRASVAAAVERDDAGVDGYMVCRRTVFMGRWIKHGAHYPAFHLRLFRSARGRCEDRRYDQHFVVDGRTQTLPGDLIDTITNDLGTWATRHVKWARMEAEEALRGEGDAAGGRQVRPALFGDPIARKRWLRTQVYGRTPLFVRPAAYFAYRYLFRLGFLDGAEGLVFHGLQGAWFRFMVDANIFEQRRRLRRDERDAA